MHSYSTISLTIFMLATLSVRAMEQKDLPVTKNFEQLTINAMHKPEPLLTLCIKHFGRARAMCNADGDTIGDLLSPESIIPENLALDIIKKFPNNVIKECAQEIAAKLSTALPVKMNIAFIDKLADCDAIVPYRTMLKQLINDPKTSKEIKECINQRDPIFQSMKAFLIAQIYARKLPEYQKTIEQQQDEDTILSPDGKYRATPSCKNTVTIWTVDDCQCIATLTGHTKLITSILWSPDGKYLVTGSYDNTTKIWTINGDCITTLTGHTDRITSLSWSLDGKYLATASNDKTAKIWTLQNNQWQCIATLTGHADPIWSTSWSLDGKYLATASWAVKIWTVDGKCIATLYGYTGPINSVSWSSDGKYLITIPVWDIRTRMWNLHLLNTITEYLFSYDEILLIKAIVDAQESNNALHTLSEHEKQTFNQLCNADQESHDALRAALDLLVNK